MTMVVRNSDPKAKMAAYSKNWLLCAGTVLLTNRNRQWPEACR